MESLYEVKQSQKKLAKEIRILKNSRKQDVRNRPLWEVESDLHKAKYEYRHRHIAYCIVRGRTRDEIEHPSENNLPNERYIEKLIESYETLIHNSED